MRQFFSILLPTCVWNYDDNEVSHFVNHKFGQYQHRIIPFKRYPDPHIQFRCFGRINGVHIFPLP